MKKEMVVAIFLGLLLGGGAAFALVRLPKDLAHETASITPTVAPDDEISPTPLSSQDLTLEILLPENQAMTDESEITISGKTKSEATVAISSGADEKVTTASADGAFSERVKLDEGSNEILIVARFNGLEAEKRLVINYTSVKF